MSKPKTKRQLATVATAAKCHSDQRLVRRTPREAVEQYAESVGAAIGRIVEHNTFSSIKVKTRPSKTVELWRLPAGRRFKVYVGRRFVGEAKTSDGITKLLSSPNDQAQRRRDREASSATET